ncbi:MAG: ECF-type sigma factor [Acidobacteriota bacterium]
MEPPIPNDSQDLGAMFEATYDELRHVAARCFARERQGITLQTTALIHEAYLRLNRQHADVWSDRVTFLAYTARVMRQVMVDEARHRYAAKRGGESVKVTWVDGMGAEASETFDLLDLHRALERLEALDERKGKIVLLRFFSAMTLQEVSTALDVSVATVNREWRGARAWLLRELGR